MEASAVFLHGLAFWCLSTMDAEYKPHMRPDRLHKKAPQDQMPLSGIEKVASIQI